MPSYSVRLRVFLTVMPSSTAPQPISVVLRTQDNHSTLRQTLSHLGLTPADELILVDSGSRDDTLAIGTSFGARIVHWTEPFHPIRTLNLGVATARHPWVLLISPHCLPLRPWLLETYRAQLAALPAQTFAAFGPSVWSAREWRQRDGTRLHDFASFRDERIVAGAANCVIRRSAWVESPFDENSICEDQFWFKHHLMQGGIIAEVREAAVLYSPRRSLRYLFRKARREFVVNQAAVPFPPLRLRNLYRQAARLGYWMLEGDMDLPSASRAMAFSLGLWAGSRDWERQLLRAQTNSVPVTSGP
jgi:glycosyltransferase involved in cell wall biosynthesis